MSTTPLVRYNLKELVPEMKSEEAVTIAVRLAAGVTLPAGCVLAEVAGTGTAVNEVQTGTISGAPGSGSFFMNYNGQITTGVAFNATGATAQSALEALSNVGVGNVTVSGGVGGPYVITFVGELGGLDQPLITTTHTFNQGTIAIVQTTPGKPANGYYAPYVDGSVEPARALLRYGVTTDERGKISIGSDYNNKTITTEVYISGYFKTADIPLSGTGALDANGVADLGRMVKGTTSALSSANALMRVR
jgi:hypothetical protein